MSVVYIQGTKGEDSLYLSSLLLYVNGVKKQDSDVILA